MKNTFYVLLCAFSALFALPSAAQVPAYVPTDGLVGWWPFNGNANDESGNGNDGAVNGATLAEDRNGLADGAYSFNSSANNFIQFETVGSGVVTISGWYKCSTPNKYYPRIFYYGSSSSSSEPATFLSAGLMGNEPSWLANYTGKFYNETNVVGSAINHSIVTADENWHHFSVSIASNAIITTYIDGVFAMSNSLPSAVNITSGQLFLGRDPYDNYGGSGQGRYNGLIDDVALYNRALTEQEIQALYTGQCPTIAANCTPLPSNLQNGLVGYWPFCGNANDESGNGNDGTVNGAVLTEDRFGNAGAAYYFAGVNQNIQTDYLGVLGQNSRTISFWAKTPNENESTPIVYGSSELGARFNATFNYAASGVTVGTANSAITYEAINIADDSWHHYVYILENNPSPVTSDFTIFQDGVLLNSPVHLYNESVPVNTISGQPFTIGGSEQPIGYPNVYFLGDLDDIGIWNRALTPEEVQELYTLDACTFTVYDTVTTYETVYDTLTTYETIYDTVTTYVTVTDTLLIDITFVGFEGQPSWLNTVVVYPNPASDHITIHYGNYALMAGYNTVITDAGGATVYSSAVNSQLVDIDINAWGAAGVYYMSIYDANGGLVAVRHIVLQ